MTAEKTSNSVTASLLQRTLAGFRLAPVAGFDSNAPLKLLGQLKEAADIARSENKQLTVRVLVSVFDLPDLAGSISALGFKKMYDRVEYVHPLDDSMPGESQALKPGDSSLTWASGLKSCGMDELSSIYREVVVGDPSNGTPVSATAADFRKDLEEDLADPAFHTSAEAIQIGFVDGQPAAFVFAQVMKQPNHPITLEGKRTIEGWSRLTYLGILPKFRGLGYGRQVHRHGLRTLRAMGGLTYHGGTARNNIPMRRLFESSGCVVLRLLEEWRFFPT